MEERAMTTDLFTYVPLAHGAAVPAEEVESAHATIEVRILWGATVLHVAHLTPPRPFYVGESFGHARDCDYIVGAQLLGARRLPVVVPRRGAVFLVIPPRALGHADAPGGDRESLSELRAQGEARPSSDWPGAHELDMAGFSAARVELSGSSLVFQVSVVNAGRRLPVGALATLEPAGFFYTGSSFLLHAGVMALFAFFMPRMGVDDDAAADRDNIVAMTKLLNASAAREQTQDVVQAGASQVEVARGSSAAAARGDAGSTGVARAARAGRYAIEGPKDNPDPHFAREVLLSEASMFGAVELLGSMAGSEPRSLSARWGRDTASGADDESALGHIFGDTIDDAVGAGGLDGLGPGEGGGGHADSIGLLDMEGLRRGPGGPESGIGVGRAPHGRTHTATASPVREELTTVNGHLRPEVIQRVVRQNFGRFRFCYEAALRANPGLQGRVVVKFAIDRSGAVALSTDAGSDLSDPAVTACVVRAFADLSFPPPDGGTVMVVYPLVFSSLGGP
jgi:hypothetical protein